MVKLMGYYQLPGSMPVQVSFEDLFNTFLCGNIQNIAVLRNFY